MDGASSYAFPQAIRESPLRNVHRTPLPRRRHQRASSPPTAAPRAPSFHAHHAPPRAPHFSPPPPTLAVPSPTITLPFSLRKTVPFPTLRKPDFPLCFLCFLASAKTVSLPQNQNYLKLAENSPKYTEKASIFFHLILTCLFFSYFIDAKSFSHNFIPVPCRILIPIRASAPTVPFSSLCDYFSATAAIRAITAVSAFKMPQNAANSPSFAPFRGQFALLYRLPSSGDEGAAAIPIIRRAGAHTRLRKTTDRAVFR